MPPFTWLLIGKRNTILSLSFSIGYQRFKANSRGELRFIYNVLVEIAMEPRLCDKIIEY